MLASMSGVLMLILYPWAYPRAVAKRRLCAATMSRISSLSLSETPGSMLMRSMISSVVNSMSMSSAVGSTTKRPTACSNPMSLPADVVFVTITSRYPSASALPSVEWTVSPRSFSRLSASGMTQTSWFAHVAGTRTRSLRYDHLGTCKACGA